MKTVTFGNKNSYADFGLILDHKEIGKPEPRTNYIDVPARDGHLDLTEAFGEVKYKERKLVFYFSYIGSDANWERTLSALHNYLNGQRHKIYFEENYYWVGRCFVGDAQTKRGIKEFTIECDCEPYKYRLEDTIIEIRRKNLFNYADCATFYITNNNDGTFAMNDTNNYGTISVSGNGFEIGKTYTFSQFVDSLEDSGGSQLEYRVLMYYKDGELITNSVIMSGANKRYSLELTPTKEVNSVDIMAISKDNNTTTVTGVISNIQIEEGSKTILNDRKTATPYVEILAGEPILSWEDKKTGVKYNGVAISSNGKYLDLKLYEGNNTLKVVGGDIRLTFREASL